MKTVLFNTYPVAFDCPGGGEIQLLKSREYLQRLGVDVVLYDMWAPQLDKIDLVHYFSVQGGSLNFCSHVKRLGLPLVLSPIIWLDREKDMYPLDEIRKLLYLSDMVLPNSQLEAEQLMAFSQIPSGKISVVCNGVDPVFEAKVPGGVFREAYHIDYPFVLSVANIEPRKNHLNLIKALKGTGLKLVVLGNIRDQSYYETCLKESDGLLQHIGYVEHGSELLRSAYDACEVFALPSMFETPGLAALEAAASGAKLVITHHGSTREYFAEMAVYVDPDDPADIHEGIAQALNRSRGNELRERTLSNFTWQHAAQQLLDAYNKVL